MNTLPGNITVDSCQYTPIYLVQNTGAIQGRSYILSQGNGQEAKPVTDNLKRFYENSGIFENNLVNNVPMVTKPCILKNQDNKHFKVGNNTKFASYLLPNNNFDNNINKQCLPVSNVILKPTVITANVVNTVVREEADRKIVKIKNFPECLKMAPREKSLPKIKPKEESPITPPIKHTSVQLLKLGETYHSINQLSNEQMKMVKKALKIFSDPEKTMEPLYDPVTNTCYVYKVVSPKDLTVVGNNKLEINNKRNEGVEIKKERKKKPLRAQEKEILLKKFRSVPMQAKEIVQEKEPPKPIEIPEEDFDSEPEQPVEIKITRSGRKVKFPKQIVPETSQKPRRKAPGVVSCFQCSTEFCSFYRLQKHYENHPTHIPAKIHSNLFHCLLAIIKSGSEEDKTNIFIQQLEQLIEKLKSLFPCLLKKVDGSEGKSCTINDDIARLFGMNPGKYNLNVDALTCVKDKDGNCRHKPPKNYQNNINTNKPSPLWPSAHSDENKNVENETEDCARINAVDKWPTANKRIWNSKKQKTQELNAKKKRVSSENSDPIIELGIEDLVNFNATDESAINVQGNCISLLDNLDLDAVNKNSTEQSLIAEPQCSSSYVVDEMKKSTGPHTQFHSTHFDIRSSPIKPSAAIFRKIQINPEKLPKYEVQVIRPLDLDSEKNRTSDEKLIPSSSDTPDLQSMLKDNVIELSPCKQPTVNLQELSFDKDWILDTVNEKSNESFMKASGAIEPSLLHIEEFSGDKLQLNNLVDSNGQIGESDNRLLSNQNCSVLNFLETLGNECLLYPETDIRSNHVESVDFQLDLFSFSNP